MRSDEKTLYFISFTDGQGKFYDLEVSEAFYIEFQQVERENRNLWQSYWRHQEASDLWDETLDSRAFRVPKSVEELIFDAEQRKLLCKAISALPEIHRQRFRLCHEYDCNYRQIGEMEHRRPQSIRHSVIRARDKDKGNDRKVLSQVMLKYPYISGYGGICQIFFNGVYGMIFVSRSKITSTEMQNSAFSIGSKSAVTRPKP